MKTSGTKIERQKEAVKNTRYSNRHKVDWGNEVDEAMDQDPEILTVAECCREKLKYLDKEAIKLSNFY